MKDSPYRTNDLFRRVASRTAHGVGNPWAFVIATCAVLVWAVSGPLFHFSDTWQLVINTGTTIITFLMVFLIQNTQNRDSHAVHLKLDELIRANADARNRLLEAEDLTDAELEELQGEFRRLAQEKIAQRSQRGHRSHRQHHHHHRHGPRNGDQKSGTSKISSSFTGERSSRAMKRKPVPDR